MRRLLLLLPLLLVAACANAPDSQSSAQQARNAPSRQSAGPGAALYPADWFSNDGSSWKVNLTGDQSKTVADYWQELIDEDEAR